MVLAWTTTDIRHRFRVATAPLPLHLISFISVASVGILALLTDLWRAEGWLVPKGTLLSPAMWQATLGGIFLLNFISWAGFAYMLPPRFGRQNSKRFASFLYRCVIDGSPEDMAIIGQELVRSIPTLIRHAPDLRGNCRISDGEQHVEFTDVQAVANDILLLIADPRFCRSLVDKSPGTILKLFQEISETKKHGVSILQFSRNVVEAAIENRNSFMYHETDGYMTGLMGYHKPISQSIFGDYWMAEEIGSILDPNFTAKRRWSAIEWEAYVRAVLTTLRSYAENGLRGHSYVLYRALDSVGHSMIDLYKLDGIDGGSWERDEYQRLKVAVDFCNDCVKILDEFKVPAGTYMRVRKGDPLFYESFLDHLAETMIEIIFKAALITKPQSLCWTVQHNTVWSEFFNQLGGDGPARRIVKFKLRRKIYDEIVTAGKWANFKIVRMLAFCLNVMGLELHSDSYGRDSRALHKAVLAWVKRNFARLHEEAPQIIAECLPQDLSYDSTENCIVKTREADAFRRSPQYIRFHVDPLPKENAVALDQAMDG